MSIKISNSSVTIAGKKFAWRLTEEDWIVVSPADGKPVKASWMAKHSGEYLAANNALRWYLNKNKEKTMKKIEFTVRASIGDEAAERLEEEHRCKNAARCAAEECKALLEDLGLSGVEVEAAR